MADRRRHFAVASVVGGTVGALVWPLQSLSYLATEPGQESPGALSWGEAGRDALEPLFDWGSVDTVYETYGKIWVVVVAGLLLGLLALRATRAKGESRLERWGFRVASVGYPLLLLGVIVEYFTPWLDFGFVAFSAPGLLLSLVGSTLLGAGLLRAGPESRVGAWLLALSIPLLAAMTAVFGHLSAGLLPLDLAWIAIGLALLRGSGQSREASASTSAD